ncbi:MAG: hypothetical protein ABR508_13150, partial [Candidatus Baltobacteraceae bacterium]
MSGRPHPGLPVGADVRQKEVAERDGFDAAQARRREGRGHLLLVHVVGGAERDRDLHEGDTGGLGLADDESAAHPVHRHAVVGGGDRRDQRTWPQPVSTQRPQRECRV